jgi:hypothetical protein
MMSRSKFGLPGLLAVGVIGVAAAPAHAETGGGDSVQCGSSPGYWNAPNGASVASRSPSGVVANILGYLGEYYSHIMISHGTTKMSHASMQTPRAYVYNSSGDAWVLEDIQRAGPGATTVNMGATYAYLYGQNEGAPEAVDYVDGGANGVTAANYLLNLPQCSTITDGSCRVAIDDPQGTRDIIGFRVAGVTYRHSYGVYTFVEDYDVHSGNHLSSPYASLQCSSFQAMTLNKAGVATVAPHFYSNAQVAPAAQGLYDIIYSFAQSGGANQSTSANLADQLANCFIDYAECDNQASTPWQSFKASGTARSISPDRIRGLGAHAGVNTPWTGATQAVQWNQAGAVYGCWAEEWRTWLEPNTWSGTGGGSPPPPSCTPDCSGDQCGQADGCGGVCSTADVNSCGMCGNATCGSCESVAAANIGSSTELRFTITGTDVDVALSGGSGDADLYVKLGSAPTTSSYGCRSWNSNNNESCSLSGTGTFHILVHAYSPFSAATLTADVATCDGGGSCTPSCSGDMCGQSDGCGGVCADTDANTCGMCGNTACGGGGSCSSLTYSASSTSSASYTDPDTVQYSVDLSAGVSYTFSTCASTTSDTYLRLHSGGSQKASNDDGCSAGYGSKFTYTPSSAGAYVLSLGCYSSKSCSGTVDISAAANSCAAM